MQNVIGRFSDVIYATMRIVVGLLFAQHGAQKMFGLFGGFGDSGGTVQLFSMMGAAGFIEFFGGIMIALGLFGSVAAFVASGEMAFAYYMAHAPRGGTPIENDGERALLYCLSFLYIAARGPGKLSLDRMFQRRE